MAPRDTAGVECIGLVDQLEARRRRMENVSEQSDNNADDISDRPGSMQTWNYFQVESDGFGFRTSSNQNSKLCVGF